MTPPFKHNCGRPAAFTTKPRVGTNQGIGSNQNLGFSLIELVVVMVLISIFFFFTIPRFQDSVMTDHTRKLSRWMIIKVRDLKEKSVIDRKMYTLKMDINNNKLWITHETMTEEELLQAETTGFELAENLTLLDVQFPGDEIVATGQAGVNFYKHGFSDKALIHFRNEGTPFTFSIEPFLSGVTKYEKYADFND